MNAPGRPAYFVLIGAAGYVAPRHMQAIKDVGGQLVAAYDPHDSVGVLDRYSPDCQFFTEFERLDRFVDLRLRHGDPVDYVVVASPNYLHDSHCRWGLRLGANVICEKPLTASTRNIDALAELESHSIGRVWNVLQLRCHPEARRLQAHAAGQDCQAIVQVRYVTPRGAWYLHSWKGDVSKSGGLATNIGVHLFDLLSWVFGRAEAVSVDVRQSQHVSGVVSLVGAVVDFDISIDAHSQPERKFVVDGVEYDFNGGFADLHTKVYQDILSGGGWGISDAREAIAITEAIRDGSCPLSIAA